MNRKLLAATALFVSSTATAGPLVNSARVTGNLVTVAGMGKGPGETTCSILDGDERVSVPITLAEITEDDRCTVARKHVRDAKKGQL